MRLKKFSKGFYRIEKYNGKYYFHDLRFEGAFTYVLATEDKDGELQVVSEITLDQERRNNISLKKRWKEWLARF